MEISSTEWEGAACAVKDGEAWEGRFDMVGADGDAQTEKKESQNCVGEQMRETVATDQSQQSARM